MTEITGKILGSARKLVRTPLNRLLNRVDPPVIVLLYHRVTTLVSDPEMLAVSPENFRAQMRHLKENHHLVRFEEDWSKAAKPAVAITFDDGYADNALEALPILDEVGVPATFFVSTGTIGTTREFWWHELERIILGGGVPVELHPLGRQSPEELADRQRKRTAGAVPRYRRPHDERRHEAPCQRAGAAARLESGVRGARRQQPRPRSRRADASCREQRGHHWRPYSESLPVVRPSPGRTAGGDGEIQVRTGNLA